MDVALSVTEGERAEQTVTKCLRTKKLRQQMEAGSNSPIRPPPAPRPSRCAAFSSHMLSGASIVSFREDSTSELSKLYDEEKEETYFEQCFAILDKLGSGSFADVFKVVSLEDNRVYAIKCTREAFKSETERQERFEEVERYETLGTHRNLIRFVKSWQERNRLYMQFEHCAFTAYQLAKMNHNIDECYVWQFLIEQLFALKHIHDRNLVHLDVKLENILIRLTDDDRHCEVSSRCLFTETESSSISYDCDESPPNGGPTTSSLNASAHSFTDAVRNESAAALEKHFAERLASRAHMRRSLRVRSHSGSMEQPSQLAEARSLLGFADRSRLSLGSGYSIAARSRTHSGNAGTVDSLFDARTPPKSGDSRASLHEYAAFSAQCGCACVSPSLPLSQEQVRMRAELVRRRGCAKLGDCGISIDLAKPNRVLSKDPLDGDAHYLAAEVLEREQFAKPADVFALALCLVELAFDLDLPSNDAAWHFLRNEPFPLNERLRAAVQTSANDSVRCVGDDLQRVLQSMLVRDPARRASVDDLLADVAVRPRVAQYLAERGLSYDDVLVPVNPSAPSSNSNESRTSASASSAFFDSDSAELSSTGYVATHKLALVNGLRAISPIPRSAHSQSSSLRRPGGDNTPRGQRRSNALSLSTRHFGALLADAHNSDLHRPQASLYCTLLLAVSRFLRLLHRVRARSQADVHQQMATLCLCPAVREPTPNKRAKLASSLCNSFSQNKSPQLTAKPRRSAGASSGVQLLGSAAPLRSATDCNNSSRSVRASIDSRSCVSHIATGKRKRDNPEVALSLSTASVSTSASAISRRAALSTSSCAPSSLRRNAMRNAQLLHAAHSDLRGSESNTPMLDVGPRGDAAMAAQSLVAAGKTCELAARVLRPATTCYASRRLAATRPGRALFTGSPTGLGTVSLSKHNFVPRRLTFDEPEASDPHTPFLPDANSSLNAAPSWTACRRNLTLEFEQE